jgi:tetratricopeptide (TPR) repeat protein
MKKDLNFWRSLEEYGWKVVGRGPLPKYWQWIGIGLVGLVISLSSLGAKNSLVGARSAREAINIAVETGDYETARELLNNQSSIINNQTVLGAQSELENKVYPEKAVERKIAELEQNLEKYPGSREIFMSLAGLYDQLNNQELAAEYLEKARVLDPNNIKF